MQKQEIIKDAAWVVENFLTPEECESFLSRALAAGVLRSPSAGDVRYRNSTTVAIDDENLARTCFERILPFVPNEVVIDDDCANDGLRHSKKDLLGTWRPCALNTRWRVARYEAGGHFGPHRDSRHEVDEHRKSLVTLNGYLTDRPPNTGGATRFVRDDIELFTDNDGLITTREEDVVYRVESDKAGKIVAFFHDLMHDGEPLRAGSPPKWIFRTEVVYQRDPDTAPKLSEAQRKARTCVKEAEQAESDGNLPQAMKLYSQAYRLDPSLESPT